MQTGPFTVTATFSEPVTGFAADDVTVTNATITGVSGGPASYTISMTPAGGAPVAVQVVAGAALDSAGNPSLASAPSQIEAASVLSEFEAQSNEIRKIITDQATRDLRARIEASQRLVRDAQGRLIAQELQPPVDRELSFEGQLQAEGLVLSTSGSFGAETGLPDGTRRILSGAFSLNRDAEGTVSARLDSALAWERKVSDTALAGWFVGFEVGSADVDRGFKGPLRSMGLSLGAYGVKKLDAQLYLNGFASVTAGRNDLQLSNGTLTLDSAYTTRSLQAGASLSGVLPRDGYEIRPALTLALGRTWLGTLDMTGSVFGGTSSLSLDAGQVSLMTLGFAPEFVVPLDGQPVADSQSLASFAPGLSCENVSGVEDWSDCGVTLGLGFSKTWAEGLGHLNADLDLQRVGPRSDSTLTLSMDRRF